MQQLKLRRGELILESMNQSIEEKSFLITTQKNIPIFWIFLHNVKRAFCLP